MTSKTKISEGYSTVLPAEIRKALDLSPGDILLWEIEDDTIRVKPRRKEILSGIIGCIKAGGDAVADKKQVQRGD